MKSLLNNQASSLLLLLTSLLLFTSCGDSGDTQITNPNPNQQNRYLGSNSFNNGQNGTLDFTVFDNGAASGTLTVANDVAAQALNITTGAYTVSGSANLGSGGFTLNGALPGLGTFFINGTLPQGTGQATYTINAPNGQTFQGTVQLASQGVPPVTGNGGGGNEGRLIQGGTVNNLEFQFSPDYNGDEPPVNSQSTISGALGEGENGEQSLTITLSETVVGPPVQINLLTVSIVDPSGADLVLNQPYQVTVNDTDAGSLATLSEIEGQTTVAGWVSEGQTSSGTATITALSDTQVTVEFNFDNLVVNTEVENNGAVGSFDLIGSITGNFATTP